jgi:aminobenzoyl-glutamate utilization protein B
MYKYLFIYTFAFLFYAVGFGQKKKLAADPVDQLKSSVVKHLDASLEQYKSVASQIWNFAEVGYKEVKSSALLQEQLRNQGFEVQSGVAGIPTAFVATYGSGKPVIALLAEYDALPGLSQEMSVERKPIAGKDAGHGCGHHLFGTATVAAGVEIKQLIASGKLKGTVKVFGCPAEEGGSGKVYLVRAGLFNEVDIALHWHPSNENLVTLSSALANKSAKFRFYGLSSHAADAPERGRSALDAVEAMDFMVNQMREHVPQETRIHYVITSGGKAPNVVPDYAEVYYYVRHPKRDQVKAIFDRVAKAAQAAALGTETRMDYEIIGGTHDLLLNRSLAELMQKNLEKVGGVSYNDKENEFAGKLQSTFTFSAPAINEAEKVKPLQKEFDFGGGSTDVGDVSYVVPTVGMRAATWVPGTPMHSWQAVASGATDIGMKGMMVAAKTMALTAIDLFSDVSEIEKASKEFRTSLGNYRYEALLGDRKPALNYRD